jgi:iron complex outermembrane receptor protein
MKPYSTTKLFSLSIFAATLLTVTAQAQESTMPADAAKPVQDAPATKKQITEPVPEKVEAIEVTGKRDAQSDRRNSTAAKIIINREDIEQYGDTNLGDVLKRLPGVTQSGGRPGRGGSVGMRGMGGGYTQILINGERNPPGFSIEQISPEQVERIEILRAPTAETGTRAVAGTINIVLREPLRTQSDEFKAAVQEERGRYSPNLSWTHNDTFSDNGTYNVSATINRNNQLTDTRTLTDYRDAITGAPLLAQEGFNSADSVRDAVYATSRIQWRLGPGEQFSLQPFIVHHESKTQTASTLTQSLPIGAAPYATSDSTANSKDNVARLNAQLVKRLDAQTRIDARANVGIFQRKSDALLNQFDANKVVNLNQQTKSDIDDKSWSLNLKALRNFESGHSGVIGTEVERVNRADASVTSLNGVDPLPGLNELSVSTRRTALYVQDEWDPAENVSANLGLRWEKIQTQSDSFSTNVNNASSVVSPVGHLVYRFASPRKDQVRLSLTQSYKAPTTQNLIARPSFNNRFPLSGSNDAANPDSAGNADLKPELAQGVDLAYERYLIGGGIVSVNLFHRNITDLIRNVPALESVSYSSATRWVSRPQNIGKAITQGIEFDTKFRLSDAIESAAPVNVRLNMSIYNSRVSDVPGPYNRIDQQPRATGNIGADYKFPKTDWAVGGNFGLTPGYTTQISDIQSQFLNTRRATEVYAQWNVTPKAKLRFGLANLEARDSDSVSSAIANQPDPNSALKQIETVNSIGRTDRSASVRLEMRL